MSKMGLDDYLNQKSIEDLLNLPRIELTGEELEEHELYRWVPNVGLERMTIEKSGPNKGGIKYFKISNFKGIISKVVDLNDGKNIESELIIDLEGIKNFKTYKGSVTVPARKFLSNINTVIDSFPDWAMIEPGQTMKDYVRHSIQYVSNGVNREMVYVHTGWVKSKDGWFYVTANGAIGRPNIKVDLRLATPNLYAIPAIPENETEAIKKSLEFIGVGNQEITIPLLLYIYLSTLTTVVSPMPNFILYLYGKTGTFKTTLAHLALSHFGDHLDFIQGLGNCSFEDTANSVERRGFHLKDAPLLLDDYCPTRNQAMSQKMYQILHRMVRNYSNRVARKRLNADSTEKGSFEPRGLLIITGEDSAEVESTVARLLELDIKEGDIDPKQLSYLQENAQHLPHAMSSFINWLLERMDIVKEHFNKQFTKTRNELLATAKEGLHKKQIEHATFIILTAKILKKFLIDKKILTEEKSRELVQITEDIFKERQFRESESLKELSEIEIFYNTIETLIDQERAYIFNVSDGTCTARYVDHGEVKHIESSMTIPQEADPRLKGEFIGWFDEEFYYFIPNAVLTIVYDYHRRSGSPFPSSQRTLKKRLKEAGLLITDIKDKHSLSKVKNIGGKTKRVLQIQKRDY